MKNQDKKIANYTKQFTKKKNKSSIIQTKDSEDSAISLSLICKFCEKKSIPNKYQYL